MCIEGSLHILRLDRPTDPEPWTYSVTFAPYAWNGGALRQRRCMGQGRLEGFLHEASIHAYEIEGAVQRARQIGDVSIPHVQLTPDEITALGLG